MRISIQNVRSATLGLCALAAMTLVGQGVVSAGEDPVPPKGTVGGGADGGGRSEDGIGTGPIVADLDDDGGKGFELLLSSQEVNSVLLTTSGSGSVTVEDQGNGTSLIKLSGTMRFQLSQRQLVSQSVRLTGPVGGTVGRAFARGSNLIFLQSAR